MSLSPVHHGLRFHTVTHRFRSDTLLGMASVPLLPLLQDCWVDGYAPVLALMVTPGKQGQQPQEQPVQVSVSDLGSPPSNMVQ
jgi:hypothetical protein